MYKISDTVKHLLIINGIFFLANMLIGDSIVDVFALHSYNSPNFGIWQLFTHMFMHGGFGHLFFNMFALWMFGTTLEGVWGRNKFLFFYFSAGLGAALMQLAVYYYQFDTVFMTLTSSGFSATEIYDTLNQQQYNTRWLEVISNSDLQSFSQSYYATMVGASGALYGLLVAFAMLFPNAELFLMFIPVPIKAKYFVPVLILADLFFGFTSISVGPIAHFAHLGGAFFGFLMMKYWKSNQFDKNRWDT